MIPKTDKRMFDSRARIDKMMQRAIGIYMAKENKIKDAFRDQSVWTVFKHLQHELLEIGRSKTPNIKLHNALDACGLCALLAVRIELDMEAENAKET